MSYLEDVWGLLSLDEQTYKKIGNDKGAFKRYTTAFFISHYICLLIFSLLVLSFLEFMKVEAFSFVEKYWYVFVGLFLLYPILQYLWQLLKLWVTYLIGKLFGGKARHFTDFAQVLGYHYPLIYPLLFILFFIGFFYRIWRYVMIYKTYRYIHKLDARKAGWATAINVGFYILFIGIFVVLYFAFIFSAVTAGIVAENQQPSVISFEESLDSEYGIYYSFEEQETLRDITVTLKSSAPVEMYIVKSEADFDRYLNDEPFDMYEGCFSGRVQEGELVCTVRQGGLVIFNPNSGTVTFTALLTE